MLHHIENKTRERLPRVPFRKIASSALPQGYELSLVFVDNNISKKLNSLYRGRDKPTSILSFPLGKLEGEILINPKIVKREAAELGEKEAAYFAYIFIHGLTHLKGFRHGSRMEAEEKKIRSKFKDIFASSNFL